MFSKIMSMAFQNLTIIQHCDKLKHATICGRGYMPSIRLFALDDFVYLQQTPPTILDVFVGHTTLGVHKILSSGYSC